MKPVRFTTTTTAVGYNTGTSFDDKPSADILAEARISRIMISHRSGIGSILVSYVPPNNNAIKRGSTGTLPESVLDDSEFITEVHGSVATKWIGHLSFVTNKRILGPFGTPTNTTFTWRGAEGVPAHFASRMALLSFSGNADGVSITKLQATFAALPGPAPSSHTLESLKYEECGSVTAPTSISQFASNLMSPSVTLCVGPESTNFYTNEAILCRLPFFKGALQGGFKESLNKTINMPEDGPAMVAALVEFLFTEKYTYSYNPATTKAEVDQPRVTIGTVTEGLFHVGVCAVASKYDCPTLKKAAWGNFQSVLGHLGDLDRLSLWRAAYNEGFQFPDGKDGDAKLGVDGGKMREWVKVLVKDHQEELETAIREDWQFAFDMLKLAAT